MAAPLAFTSLLPETFWTMATLPEKQREILVLRLIVGLSADETAVAVDSTAGAVRVAQHRALTKLRGELTNHRDKTYQDQKEQR